MTKRLNLVFGFAGVTLAGLFLVESSQAADGDLRAAGLAVPTAVSDAAKSVGVTVDQINLAEDSDVAIYLVIGKNAGGDPVTLEVSPQGKVLGVDTNHEHTPQSGGGGSDDSDVDSDGDGLSDLAEFEMGTDPGDSDTDGDGFSDGIEESLNGNPLNPGNVPNVLNIFANGRDGKTIIQVTVATAVGATFQVELSDGRGDWTPFGEIINGDGNTHTVQVSLDSAGRGALIRVAISN